MNQIVCLSSSPWFPLPTSKQQVMSRLHDAQILYFDPPVTYLAPLKDKSLKPRLRDYKKAGQRIKDGLTVYALPPIIPFYNKFRFISKLNGRKIARFVRKIMIKHAFSDPVLWCYLPTAADIQKRVPHSALVYSCVDRHSAFKGFINPAVVNGMERELAAACNAVFCTASGLYDTLKPYNERTHMIPNGANYELFSSVARPDGNMDAIPKDMYPDDMFTIKGPVLGFVGALQACIDYALVEYAAREKPEWSFVFLGKALPGVDLSALEALTNVHFLGLKPHRDLPRYLALFSVCLNLFRSGDLAKDVSPLKFYEYLATGKPIVSTPQPDQVLTYEDVVYIARSPQEFVKKCEAAIRERDAWRVGRRLEYARAASWDARVAEIEKFLRTYGVLK